MGRWIGTPPVKEAVDAALQSAAPGQEVNPLAQGAARFLGNALAKATMSVEIDLRPSGACFLRGNTEMLGMPPDSDGSWTIVSANDDVAHVEFEIEGKTFPAKIVLRDANEFTLKMEVLAAPATAPAAATPAENPVAKNPVARRAVAEADLTYEDDEPPAAPAKAAPVPAKAAPHPATAVPEVPPQKPPTSIVFKRDSG